MLSSFSHFAQVLTEDAQLADEKTAVFTFGRYNPPTRGHGKLFEKVMSEAASRGADPYVFISRTVDGRNNPLHFDKKCQYLQTLFPGVHFVRGDELDPKPTDLFKAAGALQSLGYTNLILIAGDDRVEEYKRRFQTINDHFNSFEVISAGERDPDAADEVGMSGTKARAAALANDIGKFRVATGWTGTIAEQLMSDIREGLGVK